jgi:hypothetical protein
LNFGPLSKFEKEFILKEFIKEREKNVKKRNNNKKK